MVFPSMSFICAIQHLSVKNALSHRLHFNICMVLFLCEYLDGTVIHYFSKKLSHSGCINKVWPNSLCEPTYVLRCDSLEKFIPHWLQLNGFLHYEFLRVQ